MTSVEDCPCAELNPNYPHEGYMTRHVCRLKPECWSVCDGETKNGCVLFEAMLSDSKLLNFIKEWME